jgi:hypothetical protein
MTENKRKQQIIYDKNKDLMTLKEQNEDLKGRA